MVRKGKTYDANVRDFLDNGIVRKGKTYGTTAVEEDVGSAIEGGSVPTPFPPISRLKFTAPAPAPPATKELTM